MQKISIDDFRKSNWQDIIEHSKKKECYSYSKYLFRKARECEEKGDKISQEVFSLLGAITSMILKSESHNEPYGPIAVFPDKRSAIITDFSEEFIDIFSSLISEIKDHEMRARIADVVWLRKRDHNAAKEAINSLMKSADILENPEHWTECAKRIERALRIAVALGKKGNIFSTVISHIESVLKKYNGTDPLYLSKRLMTLLLEFRKGDPETYIKLCEKIAIDAEKSGNYSKARAYWEIKVSWHKMNSDKKGEEISAINVAETFVKEAEGATSALASATHQQKAIEVYRRIGGHKERIDALHRGLLDYEQKSISEMNIISTPGIDLSDTIAKTIESVKGKSLLEALFELVSQVPSPTIAELRKSVEESAANFPLQYIFSGVKVNENGKVIARSTSMLTEDPQELEKSIREAMFNHAEFHHQVYAQTVIEPIRKQVNLEHDIRTDDFYPILNHHPFIPEGREFLYARGFKAAFDGDYEISLHLLIPQFENSIRYILTQSGFVTSGLDSEGIQDERSLNTTLYLPELKNMISEDILFDLQGLLVERFGANLRNRMAHGLMSHYAFYSHEVCYLWCLILKICCLPLIKSRKRK